MLWGGKERSLLHLGRRKKRPKVFVLYLGLRDETREREKRKNRGSNEGINFCFVDGSVHFIDDQIEIDILNRTINVLVSDDELEKRRDAMNAKGDAAWKPTEPRKRQVSRALRVYAANVGNASQGAIRLDPQ